MLYSAYERLKLDQQEIPKVSETDDLAWLRESNERLRSEMLRVRHTNDVFDLYLNIKVAFIIIGAIGKAPTATAATYPGT